MARVVLSDTSPLIALTRVDGVPWLRELFGEVTVTRDVRVELGTGAAIEPQILKALAQGWLTVKKAPVPREPRPSFLGNGEWSSICLATSLDQPVLFLTDDRLARREAVARGLRVTGTAGLIGIAKKRGLIAAARPVFEALLQSDFRLSAAVVREVLASVGELDS